MAKELSLIDAAVLIMTNEKKSFNLYDLFDRVAELVELSDNEKGIAINKFYTDLTTSAKFVYIGDNVWNLKANEKIELWEKDGSFYKEYNEVELPEEYKHDPYATTKKPQPVYEAITEVPDETFIEVVDIPEDDEEEKVPVKPVVEPTIEPQPVVEFEETEEEFDDEIFDDYDEFDEEKYNEYMDSYEDQYED